jgi:hypothetical protein
LRAELSRLFARRFTRLMLVAVVLVLGIVGAVTASETHRPTAAQVEHAESAAAESRHECEQAQTADQPGAMLPDGFDCDQITSRDYLRYVLDFREEMPELLLVLAGLLALFGYLVGASVVGVEWSSGGMTNLLLWRSQRVRLLLGKLTAVALGVLLAGIVLIGAWLATIWLIARYRGTFSQLTQGFWISLGLDAARGLATALCAALLGAALASLGRRTAAALGVVLGYVVVWEIGARLIMMMLRVVPDEFMVSSYVVALLDKEYVVNECVEIASGVGGGCGEVIPWSAGLGVVGGLTLFVIVVAAWSFRRRDVA